MKKSIKKRFIFIATAALLTAFTVQANTPQQLDESNKAYQKLIMKKMQLLADSQGYIQQEIDRHLQKSLDIQKYQVCIQAVSEEKKLKNCQISSNEP